MVKRLLSILLGLALLCGALYLLVPFTAFETVPNHNTAATHFDMLIVLGHPAEDDGTPDPEMRERVDEGVREFRAGVAQHIIMTGGPAHNKFVEANVMADYAASQGVPREAIIAEGRAKDTIQNIWYSRAIMQANGWHSAEVISSAYHLPRTALILQHYTGDLAFDWRTHAARWPPEYGSWRQVIYNFHEAVGCLKLRWKGFTHSKFLPNS